MNTLQAKRKWFEVEENKTIEKKQDTGIGEIFYGLFLFVIAYLLFMPEMFDFSSAPWYGKCLMILGTTVFSALIVFSIIVIEKEKIFEKSKKRFVGYFLFLALITFNICSYFDENVWGVKPIVVAMIFIAIMFFAIYFKLKQLLQKKMNNESNPLVLIALAILCVVISSILEWNGNVEYANVLLKVSVGFVYLVAVGIFTYFCIYKQVNRTGKEIETIIWIVFIGALILITFPFYIKWWGISSCDFDTFVTVYAALVGGGITLGGVAWTIKSEAKNRQDDFDKRENERKEEERKKAKPIFTFNMVYQDLDTVEGKRICLDEYQERFEFEVLAQLENSEHSSFKVERVYHDNQWWDILGNNVILPNKCVYFDFNFTEDVNNLFMEIKDGLGNTYYYEIKVLYLGLIARKQPNLSNKKLHTIRELKEITLKEINERIKKAEA